MILGVLVGLEAEARLARRIGVAEGDTLLVAAGGATVSGAAAAAASLASVATHLLSFGLAGGLDPALAAGDLLVPARVVDAGGAWPTDPAMRSWLGTGSDAPLLHVDRLVASPEEKERLRAASGCGALDMESGVVARAAAAAGLPFAVLRAVCDPAARTLPPAARIPMRPQGRIDLAAILLSIARRPAQLPGLMALGRDAARAKTALARRLEGLASVHSIG